MTAQPEVPGASAVILYHEEIANNESYEITTYRRIKILSASGRDKYSTVEIFYPSKQGGVAGWFGTDDTYRIGSVAGRTIHSDGKIIPFEGKPVDREVVKSGDERVRQKVFTLPDVEVGSIIEYRYTLLFSEHHLYVPEWDVRSELFARSEHFEVHHLVNCAWTSTLPEGYAAVKTKGFSGLTANYMLDVKDEMPEPDESYMPPLHSLAPRVIFYVYSDVSLKPDAFWKLAGNDWNTAVNDFIGSASEIKQAVSSATAGATSDDQRLRAIYALLMRMDNTRFSREHTAAENRANHVSVDHVVDILKQRRGSPDDLAFLFVAMARAAGMKAYAMTVVNRDRNVFVKDWLSLDQFDDTIAIVEVNGKEQFFDPGERYCPFGQLQWMHTGVTGLRQTAKGAELAQTPMSDYTDSVTQRAADLTVDEQGKASGAVTLSFTGAPALTYRQQALKGDEAGLREEFEKLLRNELPDNAEIRVKSIDNLVDYEKPLLVHADVTGQFVAVTAKRAIAPGELFQVKATTLFPSEKRETEVYFPYPERVADAVRWHIPAGWQATAQDASTLKLPGMAAYKTVVQPGTGTITLRREYILAALVAGKDEYKNVRTFYGEMATNDQQPLVFSMKAQ